MHFSVRGRFIPIISVSCPTLCMSRMWPAWSVAGYLLDTILYCPVKEFCHNEPQIATVVFFPSICILGRFSRPCGSIRLIWP